MVLCGYGESQPYAVLRWWLPISVQERNRAVWFLGMMWWPVCTLNIFRMYWFIFFRIFIASVCNPIYLTSTCSCYMALNLLRYWLNTMRCFVGEWAPNLLLVFSQWQLQSGKAAQLSLISLSVLNLKYLFWSNFEKKNKLLGFLCKSSLN